MVCTILMLSVLLVSCTDSEELASPKPVTVKNSSGSLKLPTVVAAQETQPHDSTELTDIPLTSTEITIPVAPDSSNVIHAEKPAAASLPTGRLKGVVGASDNLQAYISTGKRTLKLKVGERWEGWVISSITPNKITISAGTEKYTLHLNQSIAPEAGKQLALQNEYTEWSPPTDNSEKTPLRLTQTQRETLQKRLLSIH